MMGGDVSLSMARHMLDLVLLTDTPASYNAALSIIQLLHGADQAIKLEATKRVKAGLHITLASVFQDHVNSLSTSHKHKRCVWTLALIALESVLVNANAVARDHLHPATAMHLQHRSESHFQATGKFDTGIGTDAWCSSTGQNPCILIWEQSRSSVANAGCKRALTCEQDFKAGTNITFAFAFQ